jgi:hypothetical protein
MIRKISFIILFCILFVGCPVLLSIEQYKLSGLLLLAILVAYGYLYKWSSRQLAAIGDQYVWFLFFAIFGLGFYGGLYDFFTAFLYSVGCIGLLIATAGQLKFNNFLRVGVLILTVLFAVLMLAFHFMYSI